MLFHSQLDEGTLYSLLKHQGIQFAGHFGHRIYGKLKCKTGRHMKKINRVFFASAEEAVQAGFRPCASCMREAYRNWKNGSI